MATIFGQQVEKPYNVNYRSSFKGGEGGVSWMVITYVFFFRINTNQYLAK